MIGLVAGRHRRGLSREPWRAWVATLVSLACLWAIFYLPYYVPVSRSISLSYAVGYNNRAGVVLLLLFLFVWGLYSRSLNYEFPIAESRDVVSASQVWRWAAVFCVAGAFMYLLTHGLNGFGESSYLIDRIHMLIEGKTPYRDFEYAYGVLFLYGPYLLCQLHLSPDAAYYLFWILCLVSGVVVLAHTLNLMERPSTGRPAIFQIFCLFALTSVITTGLNYTLIRFILSPYLALLVFEMDRRGGVRSRIAAAASSCVATCLLLLVSPEMAMAFAVGSVAYFLLAAHRSEWIRGWPIMILGSQIAVQAVILMIANRLHLLDTLKRFSGGAFAFPLMPAFHILLFLFCAGLVAVFVASRQHQRSAGDGQLMVVAVSAGTLFAGLGRCDVGHVGFAGIGILLVASALLCDMPSRWRWFRHAFLFVFVLLPAVENIWGYRTPIGKVFIFRLFQAESANSFTRADSVAEGFMRRSLGEPKARIKFDLLKASSTLPQDVDVARLYPGASATLQAPFGFLLNHFGMYHDARIETGYYDGLVNVLTPDTVDHKLVEMNQHPERDLLLPESMAENCANDPLEGEKFIRLFFLFPYYAPIRNRDNLWATLCNHIQDNYRVLPQTPINYGYRVWRAKSLPR